jgi:predicted transposase/invertase (TIGR01784 family)
MAKKLHKPHDTFIKNLLSHPESASAFLEQALSPALFRQCILDKLVQLNTSYATPDLDEVVSDIILKVPLEGQKDEVIISVLVEHKSNVDHLTCIQLLTYIANGYNLQKTQKERFSVIVPVLYYHGKGKWKFRPLHLIIKNIPDSLLPYIPTFQIEMLQIQSLTREHIHSIAEAKLRATFMVQKGMHDQLVAIKDYVKVIDALGPYEKGNFLHSFFVYLLNIVNFDKPKLIEITSQLTKEMRTKSMTLYDELIAEGKEEGMAIGIEKGRQEGMQEGMQQGRQEGMQQGRQEGSIESRYEFARKLIQRNMPLADICELTGLTEDQVKGIMA